MANNKEITLRITLHEGKNKYIILGSPAKDAPQMLLPIVIDLPIFEKLLNELAHRISEDLSGSDFKLKIKPTNIEEGKLKIVLEELED